MRPLCSSYSDPHIRRPAFWLRGAVARCSRTSSCTLRCVIVASDSIGRMSSSPQPPNAVHSLPEHSPRAHAHVGGNRRIAASRNRARSSSGASANNATAGGAERYTTQSPRLPRRSPRGAVGANSPRMLGRIQPTIPRKPRGVVDSGAVGPVRAACVVRHVFWCSQRPMLCRPRREATTQTQTPRLGSSTCPNGRPFLRSDSERPPGLHARC